MSYKYQPLLPSPSLSPTQEIKREISRTRSPRRTLLSILFTVLVASFLIISFDGTSSIDKVVSVYKHSSDSTTTTTTAAAAAAHTVDLKDDNGTVVIKNARVAFTTLLTGSGFQDDGPMEEDVYFMSTRILTHQLLHAPNTRTSLNAPFIVLTTPNVRKDKIERLKLDGATVVPVDFLQASWAKTNISTWQFVFSKLHLWQMTQFDLLAFFDTDHVLLESMDGIFIDPAVVLKKNKGIPQHVMNDEAEQPNEYVMAGTPEMTKTHEYPPQGEPRDFYNIHYLEAGMFVMRPDKKMYDYQMSVLNIKDRFPPALPEQNLFNYAYRRDGNMPWIQIKPTWSSHFPFMKDIQKGAKSLHDKYWFPTHEEMRPTLLSAKDKMMAFYKDRDEREAKADIKL